MLAPMRDVREGSDVPRDSSSTSSTKHQARAEEATLVARCQSGDMEAFEAIYRRHSSAMYNLAFRMVDNLTEAEDLLQEIFLQAYKKLPSYEGRGRLWDLVVSIGSQSLPRSSQKWSRTQTIGNQEPGRVGGILSLRYPRVDFGSTRSRERHRATSPFLPVGLLALRRPGIRPSRGGGHIGRRGGYVEVSRPQSQAEATRALGQVSTGEKR